MDAWATLLRARKLLLFSIAVLTALGIRSYCTSAQSIFPKIAFSRVEIFAYGNDLPPEEMRAAVTAPLEAAVQSLPALRATRAYSNQGAVELELDFDSATDPGRDLQNVDAALAAARPKLQVAARIETIVENPNMEPVVSYALTSSSMSQAALRHLVEGRVAAAFTGTPGLGRITVFGGPQLEYRVTLDPKSVAAAGTTAGEIASAVARANAVVAAGSIDRAGQRQVVLAGSALPNAASLGGVPVFDRRARAFVPLRKLAGVSLAEGDAAQQASFDARHAVILSAYPELDADAVGLQRDVAARMGRLLEAMPAGTHAVRYWDQTRLISASQRSLRDAILLGALLAILVIYAFLRSTSMTLVAAAIIPVAMTVTVLAIGRFGLSLNLMTLGGLAIAVGLVIDEIIVVIEAIAQELAATPNVPRRTAVTRATRRIARPLIASTAANVVVFLPLAMLSDIPGFFFRALAVTLATALVISILLSLGVAPVLAELFLRRKKSAAISAVPLALPYARLVEWALDHRAVVYVAAGGLLAVTALLLARLPSDFLPALEEGQFEIKYSVAPGTSLAATDRIATTMERAILRDPSVAAEGRLTGIDTNGYAPTPQNAGTIRVALRAGADDYADVAERLRDALVKVEPSVDLEFHQLLEDQINDLSGAPEPIQLAIAGPDQRTLTLLARTLGERIARIPGIVDVFDGVVEGNQTVRVTPKRAGTLDLAGALSAGVGGLAATNLRDGDGTIPVRVTFARAASGSLDALGVPGMQDVRPLSAVANVAKPVRSSEVFETNGERMLLVTAGVENASLSAVVARIETELDGLRLPAGYNVTLGGAYQAQRLAFREFAQVLLVAVLLVFMVLLAAFNSFRLPVVILSTTLLSPIGVALALWLTRTPLNVSSFMGLLLLVGIVVRNGILLIDAANRRRLEGGTLRNALVGAGTERLRPILMTTFAAIGALLPLALGFGSGSEMERPLAIAVIGGLSTATALTLVLVPALYASLTSSQAQLPAPIEKLRALQSARVRSRA